MKRAKVICLISAVLLSYGCASNKVIDENENTKNEKSYIKITAQELDELKKSSEQWQNMKPELSRLLLIEEDLSLLISQLNTIAKVKEENTSALKQEKKMVDKEPKTNRFNSNNNNKSAPKFALQVLSITHKEQLASAFKQLQKKVPALLESNYVINVETINVKGVMYNRLKLGAYISKENATADCQKLKSQSVNCIVSYYVEQPFILD
ncbi:SPOR domain-containing protein [Pseudoalteromonas carrageenovora]|uniref:SPOR domain-containing protein n=1 Tax=Pseudoalteromonas carrageenovora TaxID=227 RepID=UPI0021189703|nr:SPOR domain-containing protein [Pseudoalteromonas carrageenovora]MCQ8890949.1 SPOR domain-containing protein [Pseudoalteromonas carrageenovora]